MNCEHCGISDSEQEVKLSDIAPNTWLCKNCFELDPHHSNWDYLKQRPYKENIGIEIGDVKIDMCREAYEHLIELLENDIDNPDLDLENNSIEELATFKDILQQSLEEHNLGTGYGEVQIK